MISLLAQSTGSIPSFAETMGSFEVLAGLLVMVAILTVLALSLNIILGFTGMLNLGQHGFWAVGAFTASMIVAGGIANTVYKEPFFTAYTVKAMEVRSVEADGPLRDAGLSVDDWITTVNGRPADIETLRDAVAEAGPEGEIVLSGVRRDVGFTAEELETEEFQDLRVTLRALPLAGLSDADIDPSQAGERDRQTALADTLGGWLGAKLVPVTETGTARNIAVFLLSLAAGGLLAAITGVLIGVPCLRLRGDYLAIATLGFGEMVRVIIQNQDWIGGPVGITTPYLLVDRGSDQQARLVLYMILSWGLVLLTILFIRNLFRSTHGRAILSVREDETAGELLGVNVTYYKVMVFAVGAGIAGVAGGLYANFYPSVNPKDFAIMWGILLLLMVVLGGFGSITGTVLAAAGLYLVQEALKMGLWGWVGEPAGHLAKERWQVFYALLLIVIMLTRPNGLLANKEINEVWPFNRLLPGGRDVVPVADTGDVPSGPNTDDEGTPR